MKIKKKRKKNVKLKNQALLSACLIVKNEEDFLPACLKSLSSWVDEIVVVDTGSEDKTLSIAKQFSQKVFSTTWNDDFSEPRNLSLSKASSRWILIIDADEIIHPRDGLIIRQTLKKHGNCAYTIPTRNYTEKLGIAGWQPDDGNYPTLNPDRYGYWVTNKVRLFLNISQLQFKGKIHELVEPSLKQLRTPILPLPIPVHHYGPLLKSKSRPAKEKMYLEIGKEKIREQSDDAKAYFEYGVQARETGKLNTAEEFFRRCLEINPKYPKVHANLCGILIQQNNCLQALKIGFAGLDIEPKNPDILNNLGICYYALESWNQAIQYFEKTIKYSPHHISAIMNLGRVYERLHQFDKAITTHKKALELAPKSADIQYRLAKSYFGAGQLQKCLLLFKQLAATEPKLIHNIQKDLKQVELKFKQLAEQGSQN